MQRAGLLSSVVIEYLGKLAKEMPSARRKAFFAYFLSPSGQKVRRLDKK